MEWIILYNLKVVQRQINNPKAIKTILAKKKLYLVNYVAL